ncbi:RDD family protein [Nocardioides sp.]|uniref:RDD family protein n=1 Tax=Nocardioides sp. TaxID=35761 RepID=UPI0035291A47
MSEQPPSDYGQAPPPPPPPAPGVPRPGELLDRFLARLIDGVLLAVVNGIIVSALIVGVLMGTSVGFGGYGTGASYAAGLVSAVLTTVIYLGYFGYMESSRGQTVGKMLMKLKTTGPDGQNPTMEQAIRRNIFMGFGILGVIPILGGLIGGLASLVAVIMIAVGINNDTVNRQAWHDHFAGETRVWKVG